MATKTTSTRNKSPRLRRKAAAITINQAASKGTPAVLEEVDHAQACMLAELEALEELGRPPAPTRLR